VFDRVPQIFWYVTAVVTHVILGLRSDRFKAGSRIKILYLLLVTSCELHTQSVGDSKILFSRLTVSVPLIRAVKVSHARL
jgi:hypothetical protein